MRIIAVMPAHNEEKTIASVIKEIEKYREIEKILVVDDGSNDSTAKIAHALGADVVRHVINMGYGGSQRTGQNVAIIECFDYVIQIDADGQHDPKYIPKFIDAIKKHPEVDLIIGSRFLNESHKEFSLVRQSGIKFFSAIVGIFGKVNVTDVTSGFKVYKVESLKRLSRTSDKHPAVEQVLEMARKKMKIMEISIEMPVRKKGRSQFNIKTFILYPLRMVEVLLKVLIFRR